MAAHTPAFPVQEIVAGYNENPPMLAGTLHRGMTMRQWYAGQALVGMLGGTEGSPETELAYTPKEAATRAFAMADAMIEQESEPAPPGNNVTLPPMAHAIVRDALQQAYKACDRTCATVPYGDQYTTKALDAIEHAALAIGVPKEEIATWGFNEETDE